jgi:hypothetical protein
LAFLAVVTQGISEEERRVLMKYLGQEGRKKVEDKKENIIKNEKTKNEILKIDVQSEMEPDTTKKEAKGKKRGKSIKKEAEKPKKGSVCSKM